MRELVDRLLPELERGEPFILLTVIDEQGSTPRAAGASMIVRADGSTAGTIGGGLLEAIGIAAAADALGRRGSVVVPVKLGGRDIQGPEMVCGGDATILVAYVPPHDAALSAIAAALGELQPGDAAWLLTACATAPGDTQVSQWLWRDGRLVAGAPAPDVDLAPATEADRSAVTLTDGRRVRAERLEAPSAVIICGAGHVGQALAPVTAGVGFRVIVLDDRPEYADPHRFPHGTLVNVIPEFDDAFAGLTVTEHTLIVVVTRSHRHDLTALVQALHTPARYIGLMSSRAKRKLMVEALRERGFGDADLERIHSPIGVAIAAETPAELAISIVAELIQARASWVDERATPS